MIIGLIIIDKLRGTNILEHYRAFKQLPDDSGFIEKQQKINLSTFLLTIRDRNAFYHPLLHAFKPAEISEDPVRVLSSLPVMDKAFINENFDLLFTPIKGIPYQQKKTGGSTGNPFRFYVDKAHLSGMWALNYYFWHQYSGYNPGDPFVTIAGTSLRTDNHRFAENTYHNLQNNYFVKGDIIEKNFTPDAGKLKKAVLIYGYPSSIYSILKMKPDFPRYFEQLKAIFTTSEQLQPGVRQAIEKAFNRPVFDIYGANDGGILGCECKVHQGYHFNFNHCYVETIAHTSGMNELLLTNMKSLTQPFIRYKVGDVGSIINTQCGCGSFWPRITELQGRTRDMIYLPDGSTIHGSLFNKIFYSLPEIESYRIIQQADYSIHIFIRMNEGYKLNDYSLKLKDKLAKQLNMLNFEIFPMPPFDSSNSKFKIIESHVV
jgi:phenylacetate-CoA ligase